jgi:hypothetical protein
MSGEAMGDNGHDGGSCRPERRRTVGGREGGRGVVEGYRTGGKGAAHQNLRSSSRLSDD